MMLFFKQTNVLFIKAREMRKMFQESNPHYLKGDLKVYLSVFLYAVI